MTLVEFFKEARRLKCRVLPEGDDLRRCLDAKDAEIAALKRSLEVSQQAHKRAHAEALRLAAIVSKYEPGTSMVLN